MLSNITQEMVHVIVLLYKLKVLFELPFSRSLSLFQDDVTLCVLSNDVTVSKLTLPNISKKMLYFYGIDLENLDPYIDPFGFQEFAFV